MMHPNVLGSKVYMLRSFWRWVCCLHAAHHPRHPVHLISPVTTEHNCCFSFLSSYQYASCGIELASPC